MASSKLNHMAGNRSVLLGINLASLLIFLAAWEFGTAAFEIQKFVLPPPSLILEKLIAGLRGEYLIDHTLVTAREIGIGYAVGALLGIGLGVLVVQYRLFEAMVYPYIIALNSVPKIAVSPLIVIWLGTGYQSKVYIAALVAFFPLLVSVITGLRSVEQDQILLMRAAGASKWQTFRMVSFPNALPSIFGGLEVAIVLAVVGAIVGEFVGASQGLGYFILAANSRLDTASMFAAFVILALMGTLLHRIVAAAARHFVFWRDIDVIAQA